MERLGDKYREGSCSDEALVSINVFETTGDIL